MKDYYGIFGVDDSADENTIKKAYRKLVKECHPDAKPGDKEAERRFKELSEAYAVLSDPEKKKQYDRERKGRFSTEKNTWKGYEDIFRSSSYGKYSDMYEELFKGMFNNAGSYEGIKKPSRGKDIEESIFVEFMEAVYGCKKIIHVICGTNGKDVEVTIPAGTSTGEKIRIKGEGKDGKNGGKNGDLILEVNIGKDEYFSRKGNDIYTEAKIPFSTAILGGTYRVRTLTGDVMLGIKKGVKPGMRMRMKGKGINGGDHYVEIQIDIPDRISEEQERLIKELKNYGL